MEQGTVRANGVDFAFLADGPPGGPLALCLHGFPDTAHTWRHLLPRLAGAGYRAVAPFLRGYAPSSVPADGAYDTGTLAVDACELHAALGGDGRAVLVGHDWGAFAAYGASAAEPERWHRVVTMAVPPLGAMGDAFFRYDQLRRSWYIFLFQTPLAEQAVAAGDLAFIDRLWADWSPGYDGKEDAAWVKESLREPANLAAAIGYYRTMFAGPSPDPRAAAAQAASASPAPQPTLYLHGRDDGCLGLEVVGPVTEHLAPGSDMAVVDRAGHFLQVERPDEVGDRVLSFLSV
ncbi:MAG: alpha/beta hydrolase [Acidimicrobiales bacterium]|nr:alpha/beta hydrolase [Acidimicrobiales bacterium]